ncbi:MAG: HAD-IA family hydrolase [Cyanobacteria bacterium J06600_6]
MSPILQQLSPEELPQVIFLDAMGTLFDLKRSVGEIYQQFAQKHSVEVDTDFLAKSFINSFKSAPSLAFPSNELATIKQQEFDWWKQVVWSTFNQLELLGKFTDFDAFFLEIYLYFGTKEPWYILPGTVESLTRWRELGIELGVISNFDSRLIGVLNHLDLNRFFTSITISSMAGFAKPAANIFQVALDKHNLAPDQAWHIGDSLVEDYQGAKNAGLTAFWLNPHDRSRNIENQLPNLCSLG